MGRTSTCGWSWRRSSPSPNWTISGSSPAVPPAGCASTTVLIRHRWGIQPNEDEFFSGFQVLLRSQVFQVPDSPHEVEWFISEEGRGPACSDVFTNVKESLLPAASAFRGLRGLEIGEEVTNCRFGHRNPGEGLFRVTKGMHLLHDI